MWSLPRRKRLPSWLQTGEGGDKDKNDYDEVNVKHNKKGLAQFCWANNNLLAGIGQSSSGQ